VPAVVVTRTLLYAIAGVAWATLAVGIAAGVAAGRKARLQEIQLATDPEKVKTIVQENPQRVKRLRLALLFDYGFLALYWLTFLWMSVALSRRDGRIYDLVGVVAAFAATATAALDVLENVRTRGILALSRPSDQVRREPVAHLRRTSLAKWLASALTLGLLAVLFLPGDDWVLYLGFAFLAVAVVGLLSVFWTRLIPLYFLAFFAIGATVAVAFTFWAGSFVEHL
jgi:hypothetical protein